MNQTRSGAAVAVGIDGSPSAVHAARWASREALRRGVALRLIYVIESHSTGIRHETEVAEAALRSAHDAVNRSGPSTQVQTTVVRGPVAAALIAESAHAHLLCLGAARVAHRTLKLPGGTIAAAVALPARCQVAIIRTQGDGPPAERTNVAVVVDDSAKVGAVVRVALEVARSRGAGLLALRVLPPRTRQVRADPISLCLTRWLNNNPDVPSEVLTVPTDIPTFLAARQPVVELIVAGNARGQQAGRLIGPYARAVLRNTDCSVLLIR